jgi:molybdopterin converting factor small subunit
VHPETPTVAEGAEHGQPSSGDLSATPDGSNPVSSNAVNANTVSSNTVSSNTVSSNPGSVQPRRGRCAGGVERAWHATRDERHLSTGVPVMVSVFIPPAWRDLTGDVVEVNVAAGTVRQLVNALEERFPGLRERAVMDDALRPGLAVAINGTVSRLGLRQPVPAGAEVHFLPAIGGG